jgi:hypothetical protein
MEGCRNILSQMMSHKEAGPFLEPVLWKEWGLLDYPVLIKNPMDLGKVKTKMDAGEYSNPLEFKRDVNLVWNNCMTYNQDGSEYYQMASRLKKVFEDKFSKLKFDPSEYMEEARPPTVQDKKSFSQNIYLIGSEELGRVVQILDHRCERCIRKVDPDDIEIDIDAIDPATFWIVDTYVKNGMPSGAGRAVGKKSKGGGGGGSSSKKKKTG